MLSFLLGALSSWWIYRQKWKEIHTISLALSVKDGLCHIELLTLENGKPSSHSLPGNASTTCIGVISLKSMYSEMTNDN